MSIPSSHVAEQALHCLAKRFNLFSKLLARSIGERFKVWSALAFATLCLATIAGCSKEKTTTEIQLDRPMVRVEIGNPDGVKGSLFRIDGDRQTEVARLDPAIDPHAFLVPDGFYFVRAQSLQPDSEGSVPIPAVAEILQGEDTQYLSFDTTIKGNRLELDPCRTGRGWRYDWCGSRR